MQKLLRAHLLKAYDVLTGKVGWGSHPRALARKVAEESLADGLFNVVMFQQGTGLLYDGLLASYHEDYSSYVKLVKYLKQAAIEADRIDHYIVSLKDPIRHRPLTYKTLAQHILTREKPA